MANMPSRSFHDGDPTVRMRDQQVQREIFLSTTRAMPTPTLLYALWLSLWRRQGGKVAHTCTYAYDQPKWIAPEGASVGSMLFGGASFAGDPRTAGQSIFTQPIDYSSNMCDLWMPTRGYGTGIPTAHGAASMTLMVLLDFVDISLRSTSNDCRSGWEWGHTDVMTLRLEGSRIVAWTNDPDHVATYPDVEKLLKRRRQRLECERSYRDAVEQFRQSVDSEDGVNYLTSSALPLSIER